MRTKKEPYKRPIPEDTTVNGRITLLRHSLKLTQIEFAKKILISNGFIAGIELGKRKVNDRLIRLIKITFGVNETWLRTGEGPLFEKEKTPDYKISDALELFKKLSPPLQDIVLEHLNKLLAYEQSIKEV
jgi:transcriptional regulator with XRE-family HTH domain